MMHDKVLPNVKAFSAFNDRIYYICIAGKIFDVVIINCYAPKEEKNKGIKDKFNEEVKSVWNTLQLYCIKMVVGHINANIRNKHMYRPVIGPERLHEVSNENGIKLINFAYSKEFTISSTYFPRKNIHKYI